MPLVPVQLDRCPCAAIFSQFALQRRLGWCGVVHPRVPRRGDDVAVVHGIDLRWRHGLCETRGEEPAAPGRRTRRGLLHLSYSCAPPILATALVTHDPE